MTKATTVKKMAKKAVAKAPAEQTQYQNHQAGSRKGQVHETYDRDGFDAATKLGKELGLADATVKSWCAGWHRSEELKKKAAKAARKRVPMKRSR